MKKSDALVFVTHFSQALPLHKMTEDRMSGHWGVEEIRSHLKGHPAVFLTTEDDLVAFILYLQVGEVIEICYLETLSPFRRQGHMGTLISELIGKNEGKTFWLGVHGENQAAQKLYQKLGFKNNGLRKGYYRDGGDCLLLERASKA